MHTIFHKFMFWRWKPVHYSGPQNRGEWTRTCPFCDWEEWNLQIPIPSGKQWFEILEHNGQIPPYDY